MESTHKTLHLYIPISERSCVSPSLSHCRGPSPPFEAPLKTQLTSHREEAEGPAEADKLGLADLKETLKALDNFSEILGLLPSCLECQDFMSMGNQQGTKIKPNSYGYSESRDALPKSPKFQIPRKRRRRVEGLVYAGSFQHSLKTTPGTPRMPQKARRLTKLRITNSPTVPEWDVEEDRMIMCTPAARRKRVMGKERVTVSKESLQEPKPTWRVRLPDPSSAGRKDFSVKEEPCLSDSDTDISEYDNDIFSAKTEDRRTRNVLKAPIKQAEREEEMKAEAEEQSSQCRYEEMGKEAAAQRVIGKIEEVEGIIRRVSLTSSDLIREGGNGREEEFCSRLEIQNKGCDEENPLLVEELHALGEALSQSLRQVLKMEGAKAEREAFKDGKKTSCKQNLVGSTRRLQNLSPKSNSFTSTVPNNSSLVPSPTISSILDVSQRTSSGFEGLSPILSPQLTSSKQSLPASLTDQHEREVSEHHVGWMSSAEASLLPQGDEGRESAATVACGTENDQKNIRKILENQTLTSRRTSETVADQDDLLLSGNIADFAATKKTYGSVNEN